MDKLSKKELVALCTLQKIKGISGKNKKQLIELLDGNSKEMNRSVAEKSADEWMPLIKEWLIRAIMDPQQHRDIGKVLAQATELVGVEILNNLSKRNNKM